MRWEELLRKIMDGTATDADNIEAERLSLELYEEEHKKAVAKADLEFLQGLRDAADKHRQQLEYRQQEEKRQQEDALKQQQQEAGDGGSRQNADLLGRRRRSWSRSRASRPRNGEQV